MKLLKWHSRSAAMLKLPEIVSETKFELIFSEKKMGTVKSRIQYAHLYNTHPKLSQENCGKTLV